MSSSSEYNCAGESPSSSGFTPRPSRRYEVGDEVELTVRVVGKNGVGCTVSVVGCEDEAATSFMWPVELDAGRLKPRPIKVGDRVDHMDLVGRDDERPGTAIAIHKEWVWVEWPDGSSGLWDLSQMVKV